MRILLKKNRIRALQDMIWSSAAFLVLSQSYPDVDRKSGRDVLQINVM
jgi:hypothetical protein